MHSLISSIESFPLQTVTAGDLNIDYRSAGNGDVILLLHGISSGSSSWVNQLQALSADYKVIAWDVPGYGCSDDLTTDNPRASDYADALYDFIVALGITKPMIVGHSLGALIASAFASRYPSQLAGLVLADPAQGYGNAAACVQERTYQGRISKFKQLGADGVAADRASALLSVKANEEKVALVARGMRRLRLRGYSNACYLLAYDDIWAYLPEYGHSLLVLCGDEDDITTPESAIALTEKYGRALYVSIAGAGHASYIDSPEAFNKAVLGFCLVKQADTMTNNGNK